MKTLTVALIFLLLFLQYKLWFADSNLFNVLDLDESVKTLRAHNNQLKDANEVIMNKIRTIREETQAIEKSARFDLGMIKEGEVFYRIVEFKS